MYKTWYPWKHKSFKIIPWTFEKNKKQHSGKKK